jgi:hypothetical protein
MRMQVKAYEMPAVAMFPRLRRRMFVGAAAHALIPSSTGALYALCPLFVIFVLKRPLDTKDTMILTKSTKRSQAVIPPSTTIVWPVI